MERKFFLGGTGALLLLASAPQPAMADGRRDWNVASRIGEVALGVTALGIPIVEGDREGLWQAGGSMLVSGGITQGLKQIVHERRPDGRSDDSFPSGHTALSFAAAATMHRRYGWEVGIPATLVATFVGVARVKARKHHWYDVVAGAALGEASGMLITRPLNHNVRLVPWADSQGGGLAMSMKF